MKPKLKPILHVFFAPPSTYTIIDWGKHQVWEIHGDEDLAILFKLADGSKSIEEIAQHTGIYGAEDVQHFFESLHEIHIVTDRAELPLEPDNRLHSFETYASPEFSATDYMHELQSATVVIIGVGGTGSWVAQALTMQGVGRLVLIDPDVVELSNLHRQTIYKASDAGKSKVQCSIRELSQLNPDVHFEGIEFALDSSEQLSGFENVDLIISCADEPSTTAVSKIVSEFGFAHDIPHIVGLGYTSAIAILPQTILPSNLETSCIKCNEPRTERGEFITIGAGGRPLGPLAATLGQFTALEALRVLTGFAPPMFYNKRGEFNTLTFSIDFEPIVRQEDCPFCSSLRRERVLHE